MLRRGRSGARRDKQDPSAWMLTFSDLLTLMLTFFVLLLSMANVDKPKLEEAFGVFQDTLPASAVSASTEARQEASFTVVEEEEPVLEPNPSRRGLTVEPELRAAWVRQGIDVIEDARGISLILPSSLLFAPESAALGREGREVLQQVGRTLSEVPYDIRVEGHTDDTLPVGGRFQSNGHLSIARAAGVVRYLVEEGGLDPRRISGIGYGQQRPLFPNDTESHQAGNRRVEIVLIAPEG